MATNEPFSHIVYQVKFIHSIALGKLFPRQQRYKMICEDIPIVPGQPACATWPGHNKACLLSYPAKTETVQETAKGPFHQLSLLHHVGS